MSRLPSLALALALACAAGAAETPNSPLAFTLKGNDGKEFPLKQLAGDVVLLVNVASKCGNTPQYEGLEHIYEKYKGQGFTIVAVPANNFGAQEPGSDAQIRQFCTDTYKVTFPLMAKVSVKGADIDPLYTWLTTKSAKPGDITWNFAKFLIGRDGQVVDRFDPKTKPEDATIIDAIEKALAAPKAKADDQAEKKGEKK